LSDCTVYSSQMVRDKSPGQLLCFLFQHDLTQTIPEATKLLQLVRTIPATTASAERSFSVLKRMKRVENGPIKDDSSLDIISIASRPRHLKLRANRETFYSSVTDVFTQKDRWKWFTSKCLFTVAPSTIITCVLCKYTSQISSAA
jgi:hypothetical protein